MKIVIPVQERGPDGNPVVIATKMLYGAHDFTRTCSEWVRETEHRHEPIDRPVQTSGLSFKSMGSAKNERGSIAYMRNSANDIQHSQKMVALTSVAFSDGHGFHVYQDNFNRAMALFAARKVVPHKWYNDTDEYCAPTPAVEASGLYERFVADATILALFHPANNCTSVRGIEFKGEKIDIHNNLFWKPVYQMRQWADEYGCHSVYVDLRGVTEDTFFWTQMDRILRTSSTEAMMLLNKASWMLAESMSDRDRYGEMHPELHLNTWDAGYYQLHRMWKDRYPERDKEIQQARLALERKLMPEVYELGFLRTYEGMGMQTHEAVELARKYSEGEPIPSEIKTDNFDKCSVCEGAGCAFCHGVGSREEFLYRTIVS